MAVGTTPQRIDAVDKVTGAATYPADRVPNDALHAVVVFTNQPHARLVDLDFTEKNGFFNCTHKSITATRENAAPLHGYSVN